MKTTRDGRLLVDRQRSWGQRSVREDPASGRPMQCVAKMNHNEGCGSFSFLPSTANTHYTHTELTHPSLSLDSPTTTTMSKALTRQFHASARNPGEMELRTANTKDHDKAIR